MVIQFTLKELEQEVWKPMPVAGFDGSHEISNLGRVRGLSAYQSTYYHRLLSFKVERNGYIRVSIGCQRHKKLILVHRAVALAFIGPCPVKYQVNHKDGVKANNRVTNLEYVTRQENSAHAQRMGLYLSGDRHPSRTHPEKMARGLRNGVHTKPERRSRGERHGMSKFTENDIRAIRKLHSEGSSYRAIARTWEVAFSTIERIVNRVTWTHVL